MGPVRQLVVWCRLWAMRQRSLKHSCECLSKRVDTTIPTSIHNRTERKSSRYEWLQCIVHCWLGHLTREIIPEMIYNVLSGTLNPAIPYHTIPCTELVALLHGWILLQQRAAICCWYWYQVNWTKNCMYLCPWTGCSYKKYDRRQV